MNIGFFGNAHPVFQAIDRECEAAMTRLAIEHNLDACSVAAAMTILLSRQLAIVDQPRAARFVKAVSEEIAANWTDPAATERRVLLTTELCAIAKEKGVAMREAEEARAANQIS